MSDDQLPEDLAALFAAERVAPVAVEGAKALVKAKLAASVVGVPLGASAGLLGAAGKLIGVLALTVGIGAGAIAVSRGGGEPDEVARRPRVERPAPAIAAPVLLAPSLAPAVAAPSLAVAAPSLAPVNRPARSSRRPSPPLPAPAVGESPVPEPVVVESAAAVPVVPPPPAPPLASPPPPSVALSSLPAEPVAVAVASPASVPESSLLAQAWSALSRRDAARALVLVREGEHLYPAGPLTEEREAIRISALAQLHRRDDARAAATRFLHSYPHSIHRPLVQRALEETP